MTIKSLTMIVISSAALCLNSSGYAQDSFGDQKYPKEEQQGFPQQPQYPQQQYPQQPYPQQQQYPQQPQYPQQGQQQYPQQGYPQQPQYPQQGQPQYPQQSYPPQQQYPQQQYPQQPPPLGGSSNLDQLMAKERQDFGVRPTQQLHGGPMHGPTPSSIPGGQLITTKGLVSLIDGRQAPFLLFDVLGAQEKLPGAIAAVPAHKGGSFQDATQREFSNFLQGVTKGNKEMALVFYCQSVQCWMSYNASLRAINLGYTNVLWYRGGIEAWKTAGRPMQPAQMGYGR